MIRDTEKLSIEIKAEQGFVPSDTATSLGLIITELVINSLKHAFPENEGEIKVTFDAKGDYWKLVVQDDGIGMWTGPEKPKPGKLIFSLTVPGRLPSWNDILGMEQWARYKFKNSLAKDFLSNRQ